MSKPAFTPGPWRIGKLTRTGTARRIWRNDEGPNSTSDTNTNFAKIADNVHNPADAHLISAAPDMYEALKAMTSAFRPFSSRPIGAPNSGARAEQDAQIVAHKIARDALAKAEGRS